MDSITIKIPFKTPTINHLYGQRGVRKFLKPEAKKLREEIREIIINTEIPLIFAVSYRHFK